MADRHRSVVRLKNLDTKEYKPQTPVVGFVGAGNYASRILIPAFKSAGAQLHSIAATGGVNAVIHGKKSGFAEAVSQSSRIFESNLVNTVAIATPHNSHARLVVDGLTAGKHVFVEKPLAITSAELVDVINAYNLAQKSPIPPRLMVGFNRRFAPQVQKMKSLLSSVSAPKSFIMTMNAGEIPADHWTQDIAVGGGRIIGEACHFIDLMRFLAGSEVVSVQARRVGDSTAYSISEDKASITLGFADGSFGTIFYLAHGSAGFPKERVEVFTAGKVLQLDNFRKLRAYGWSGFTKMNLWKQDKGQFACAAAFIRAIEQGIASPIPAEELFEVSRVSIEVAGILRAQ